MSLKLERPMVFVDLEATGVDVQRDRIVQIACVRLSPDDSRESFESLVDPEMRIPAESSAIHGIRDADVRGKPTFKELAPKIIGFFGDADFGGFGICRFDLPMLAAEFKRAGLNYDFSSRRSVDAMLIFHRMEPRSLSAALQFYCGKTLENAHNAQADAEASLDVLLAQIERYGARATAPLPGDVQGLHEWCNAPDPRCVDSKGKFVWRHGVATFNFGKHQTHSLEEVVKLDRSYLEWLIKAESTSPEVAEITKKALAGIFPRQAPKAGSSPGPQG
ncbi:MAG: 3'-5' exonuclease [Elusimicrobia bacterium]|nr:3'-5' exonuclease [Elusimicrobiota bacterium]